MMPSCPIHGQAHITGLPRNLNTGQTRKLKQKEWDCIVTTSKNLTN